MDFGIIFGASGSKADQIYQGEKDFAIKMLNSLVISPTNVLPGIIQYGASARVEYQLGDILNIDQARGGIQSLKRMSGRNLNDALEVAKTTLFAPGNGARENVQKSLLVLVDKQTENNMEDLGSSTQALKNMGVQIVVVGIGSEVDRYELQPIAKDGDSFFFPDDLPELQRILHPVRIEILPGN